MVVEPYSKTAFDAVLGKLRLAGVGLRTKYSYFHVYAYALYVDGAGANKLSSLTAQKGACSRALASLPHCGKTDYFAGLVSEPFAKRLELVFLRDITGADMREAFVVSLGPRTNDTAALTAFFAQFDGLQLKAGTRMSFDFAYSKEGCQLTSAFQGQPLGTIASASLARALLDVYLGDAPVSADIKPSVWERREAAV